MGHCQMGWNKTNNLMKMNHVLLLLFFLFFDSSSSFDDSSGCFATDGDNQGLPCVFPFTDGEGTIHHRCTTADDPYGEKWCATKTDQDHSVIEWGHCSPGCQDREDRAVSMMAVGPTGVGKSSLLNSLLCPAKWSTEYEDCHFHTADSIDSVTKNITLRFGPWLGTAPPLVKVFDTPGLGDSDGIDDATTLENIVKIINSETVNAILLVFKATDRFSQHIQKQLRTLEYVLGPQLWDHVITVYTFWGFGAGDVKERIMNCIKERKAQFGGDVQRTKNNCTNFDFENEKVEEMTEGFQQYLGVNKTFPYAFPHPVFDFTVKDEKERFFAEATTIYDHAKTMSALECDEQCQIRLKIALKSGKNTPSVLGREFQQFDADDEIYLVCNLYLGLGKTIARDIRWWHNSSAINIQDMGERIIEDKILLDVVKESRLIIPNATFSDAGTYKCSTTEKRKVRKSLEVTVKVLPPCKAGYNRVADSEECVDTDECSSDIDDCSPEETCFNTVGSWTCCSPGYQLAEDGQTCTDIDECQSGGSDCLQAQSCFNTPGSFVCCDAGLLPSSADPSQCLACSQPDQVLNSDTQRCITCPEGFWPSTAGFECSPCNLLDDVRFSEDKKTCVRCPSGTTPTEDSTECLDCSGEYNFYTSIHKTRCAVCPGGLGATEDHLHCHSIDGQWGSWGSWTQCSKSCIGVDGVMGQKSRDRQCTPPKYGGEDCDPDDSKESQPCRGNGNCPVDGYWDPWTQWGPCSRTCGGGTRRRNRFCNKGLYGGKDCFGNNEEMEECNEGGCPNYAGVAAAIGQVAGAITTGIGMALG